MKTTILLIMLISTLCFSQTPVKEIYVSHYGNRTTVEVFKWGEDRSQLIEYYFYDYGRESRNYRKRLGYDIIYPVDPIWWEHDLDDNCEEADYLYEYGEDDYDWGY